MQKALFIFLFIVSVILIGIVISLLLQKTSFITKKDVFHIAVAGPMSGDDKLLGDAMLKGINLCLDQVNKSGGINGKQIVLDIFDDQNNEQMAVEAANRIASEKQALIVIGHYHSSTSLAAGEIYEKNEIPAITASATSESVTKSNWYFRVIPNNCFQAEFIATYIRKVMLKTSASIIFDNDDYGTSLATSFEEAALRLGIEIKMKRMIDKKSSDTDFQVINIITELSIIGDPGVLFFATDGDEAVKVITYIKNSGMKFLTIGADSFSNIAFLEKLKKYPMEQTRPGFYSDDIYATSPFVPDIAAKRAHIFKKAFIKKYHKVPTWIEACYYDAMLVAIEAIKRANIQENKYIRSSRQKIKEALASVYSIESAVKGVSGDIFFDTTGDVGRPYMIGIYQNQILLPSFSQYQQVIDIKQGINIFEKALKGEMIIIKGIFMNKSQIVHTGIHINQINDLDIRNSSYTIDFFIWFRFKASFKLTESALERLKTEEVPEDIISKLEKLKNQEYIDEDEFTDALKIIIGNENTKLYKTLILDEAYFHKGFDDTDIEFVNAVNPINLKDCLYREEKKDITIRLYRVKAVFKSEFDFHSYPFGHKDIFIRFRHSRETRDKLIYTLDKIGLPASITSEIPNIQQGKKIVNNKVINNGWNINDITIYEDIISNISTLGNPRFFDSQHAINYSQMNIEIEISKQGARIILDNFLLIILITVALYALYFTRANWLIFRIFTALLILLSAVFYHLKFLSEFPVEYLMAIEYAIFMLYGLTILSVFISVIIFNLDRQISVEVISENKEKIEKRIKQFTDAGRILHPVFVSGIILFYIYIS